MNNKGVLKYEGSALPDILYFSHLIIGNDFDASGTYCRSDDGVYRKANSPVEFRLGNNGFVQWTMVVND